MKTRRAASPQRAEELGRRVLAVERAGMKPTTADRMALIDGIQREARALRESASFMPQRPVALVAKALDGLCRRADGPPTIGHFALWGQACAILLTCDCAHGDGVPLFGIAGQQLATYPLSKRLTAVRHAISGLTASASEAILRMQYAGELGQYRTYEGAIRRREEDAPRIAHQVLTVQRLIRDSNDAAAVGAAVAFLTSAIQSLPRGDCCLPFLAVPQAPAEELAPAPPATAVPPELASALTECRERVARDIDNPRTRASLLQLLDSVETSATAGKPFEPKRLSSAIRSAEREDANVLAERLTALADLLRG